MTLLRKEQDVTILAPTPEDIRRVLTPVDEFNKFAAPGRPLQLGFLDAMTDLTQLGANPPRNGNFTLMQMETYRSGEIVCGPGSSADHALSLYKRLLTVFPAEAFQSAKFDVRNDWYSLQNDPLESSAHLDDDDNSMYSFTALASAFYTTFYYPELSPHEFGRMKKFNHAAQVSWQPAPGEVTVLNNNRHVHAEPANTKTAREWIKTLESYGDASAITDPDHNDVRRFRLRAQFGLHEEWAEKEFARIALTSRLPEMNHG